MACKLIFAVFLFGTFSVTIEALPTVESITIEADATIAATEVIAIITTIESPPIEFTWTKWFDRDNPSGTGDYETQSSILNENPTTMCKHPVGIECKTTDGEGYGETGDLVTCCASDGLVCMQNKNKYRCADYKVRFLCPVDELPVDPWTQWFDRDDPSHTGDWETVSSIYAENPDAMCENPTGIECLTTSGESWISTGETLTCCAKEGLICKLTDQKNKTCSDYKVRFLCPGL